MSTLTTEVPLTDPELKLLQTLVYQECGMYFDERRTHFRRDRRQRRLKACQMDSFYSYYRLLTSREGKQELTALLENLTVNETSFFRIRRLLPWAGALHPRDSRLRRAGLLLPAQSAALRNAHA